MGKIKAKGKTKGVLKTAGKVGKLAVKGAKFIPGVGTVASALDLAGGLIGGKKRGVAGFRRRRRSLYSRIMKMRKQGIIEREKAKLNRIKLSAFK